MTRSLILCCSLLFFSLIIKAQTPVSLTTSNVFDDPDALLQFSQLDCDDQFGGSLSIDTIIAQSNEVNLMTSYLCFGDQFQINNTFANLTGDPDGSTAPGIGYVFYDCPPSVTGPTKLDVLGDPCLNQTNPIVINGTDVFLDDFWIATDDINGDILIENDGDVQNWFNGGDPIQFWFAPITLHDFANNELEAGDASCVHVNTNEAFSVVYLNEITISNMQTQVNGNGCTGSFMVEGGMPEFDGLVYGINIHLASNPDIMGSLAPGSTSNTHGDNVVFNIPQPGTYIIEIIDAKNCNTAFTMDMSGCEAVTLTVSDETANPGEPFCFSISTMNFNNVQSLQFSFSYDPALLQFDSTGNFNLVDLDASQIFNPQPGQLTFSWIDTDFSGESTPDGTEIFDLCFTVIGSGIFTTQLAFSGVPAQIEAIDANGDNIGLNLEPGTLNSFSDLEVIVTVDSVDCGGNSTGQVELLTTGGTAPYNYLWQAVPGGTVEGPFTVNASGETSTIANLPAGMYSFTLTDSTVPPITETQTVEVQEEPAIFVDIVGTSPTCPGDMDGSFAINLLGGGVPPFSIEWSNGAMDVNVIDNLTAGSYDITVTDVKGCTKVASGAIGFNSVIQITATTLNHVTCQGAGNDGSITVNATGGNGNFSFEWADGTTGPTINNLIPGEYFVTATDQNGCSEMTSFTINAPILPTINSFLDVVVSCLAATNGSLTIDAQPTNAPIDSYTWSPSVSNSATATNLTVGSYSVTVTAADGCSVTDVAEVVVSSTPELPTIISFDDDVLSCPGATDGMLTVQALPASSPIDSYTWSPAVSTSDIASGLAADTYYITVTAADGCSVVDSSMVTEPAALVIGSVTETIPTCPGESSGLLGLTMLGGTAPYSFAWSTGDVTGTIPALMGDSTYCVTITDANNCPSLDTCIFLADPPPIGVVLDNGPVMTSCSQIQICDGATSATAFGGTGTDNDYTFQWSSGHMTTGSSMSSVADLCQGQQSVVVSKNGCSIVETFTVDTPAPVNVLPSDVDANRPSCFGFSDGSVSLSAVGGTPPYNYFWESGETGPGIQNVPAGSYNVFISDFNDCPPLLFNVTLGEPAPLTVDTVSNNTFNVSCNGDFDGQIVLETDGGTQPYSFMWTDNVSSSSQAVNLETGAYGVTVTDANNCTTELSYTISEPPPIIPFIPVPEEPLCYGQRTVITVDTAVGGNGELYTFSVNGGPRQNRGNNVRVPGGRTHDIRIFDGEDCFVDTTIFIGEPAEVVVDLGPDIEIQLGDSVRLQPSLFVPLAIDSIVWTPTDFMNCTSADCLRPFVRPLDHQTYNLTVYDSNGCKGEDEILVRIDKNRNVYIPNIFSPNGDGFNDTFRAFVGPGVRQINSFQVFDRWGEILYEKQNFLPSDNKGNGWNGRSNGKVMNPQVFVYLIEVTFEDDLTLLYRGDVTLIY